MHCNQCKQTFRKTGCVTSPGLCITLGPNAPALVSPNVFAIPQERFDLRLSGNDAEGDVRLAMAA